MVFLESLLNEKSYMISCRIHTIAVYMKNYLAYVIYAVYCKRLLGQQYMAWTGYRYQKSPFSA